MPFQRLPMSRLLSSTRPLRPPRSAKPLAGPRLFTQNSQLLLVSGVSPRPQLPFLHPATGSKNPPSATRNQFQNQLSRLITTERKLYFKDQLWKGAKYSVYGWAGLLLLSIMAFGLRNEVLERRFPSPPEWSMISRIIYRNANDLEHLDPSGTDPTDWSSAGDCNRRLLKRLEDPAVDGRDLRPLLQEEGDIYVAGSGKAGLDVSSKSEPWRRGYYTCLMGIAKASENREGWVCDTTRNKTFPPEYLIGPSNPRPKPVPYGAPPAPLEENCVPDFSPAENHYMKILTTQGFNTRQRLDAALAYADWLDFKGLSSTAEEMYSWGLDIAMGALPVGVNNIIDLKSGVIDQRATYISSNVLLATTSLAFHHARNNNLAAALPIYLSVLRARRQLPALSSQDRTGSNSLEGSSIAQVLLFFQSMIVTPPYPPAPPTGDEIAFRTSAAKCEEAGVMAHVGEILFASSSAGSSAKVSSDTVRGSLVSSRSVAGQLKSRQSGLSWTRDAVDLAEATLTLADKDDEETRDKCSQCLALGMDNWSKMVAKLLKDERKAKAEKQPMASSSRLWGSSATVEDEGRWEREFQVVDERLENVRRLLSREADRKESKSGYLFM
ncbi:hypothetical protein HO173_008222 [Letharia columbiana]|uniref:MFS maltose permease n=1 Tax=Letharia columbiana TaxID=112416 RepID=A0A8H6FS09_9LECA|nr:uncharacterized protein HO173_008222 [Letharia columbiana]KAF6233665.1 hypothetical protein HO173_008222 [Letharia columbiana]